MIDNRVAAPGFWRVVWLLLEAAHKRAAGRRRQAGKLARQRGGGGISGWSGLGVAAAVVLYAAVSITAGVVLGITIRPAERVQAEWDGAVVVGRAFIADVRRAEVRLGDLPRSLLGADRRLQAAIPDEAARQAQRFGGVEEDIATAIREAVLATGSDRLRDADAAAPGLSALPEAGAFPALIGSLVLLGWGLMLVCAGEGLEIDTQRRRHPMWEFLLSHPVSPRAVFLAEMISPIAGNPALVGAPLFCGVGYGLVYGPLPGCLAVLVIGLPLMMAAACLGKAVEIAVLLRLAPRSRGAAFGLMGWFGHVMLLLLLASSVTGTKAVTFSAPWLRPLTAVAWPWIGLFLGQRGGEFSFASGVLDCWLFAALVVGSALALSQWGISRGLDGATGRNEPAARKMQARPVIFGRNALYRKELLWLRRDRGAIVQAVLLPLTMAAFQLFQLRGLAAQAMGAWNALCGAAILFGTYFLGVLGPKSLASEGKALWIPLGWPHGMEELLKAKARLWAWLSSAVVALVLVYSAVAFPIDIWKIALVGVGWMLFARSMSEKGVTLATVTADSAEVRKLSWSQRLAAQLGSFTFALGLITEQWPLAITGIVYSAVTSAAMWQNFRARLPYLLDPWSEERPQAPTLLHAMVGISTLVELAAIGTSLVLAYVARSNVALGQAVIYGLCGVAVSVGMARFLAGCGVTPAQILLWPREPETASLWWPRTPGADAAMLGRVGQGALIGVALGACVMVYLDLIQRIPAAREMIEAGRLRFEAIPHAHAAYAVMAVAIAPFCEEFLFRGLLFRALDREWGGWRAVLGSAAFFAIYHPVLSWLPVGLVGVAAALIFKRTGRLEAAMALHVAYNAVVTLA